MDFDFDIAVYDSSFVNLEILLLAHFAHEFTIWWEKREWRPLDQFSSIDFVSSLMQWASDTIVLNLGSIS